MSLKITLLWFGLDNNDCCFFHLCIVWRFLLRTEAGSPKINLQRRERRRSLKALCLPRKISVNLRGNTLGYHKQRDRDSCSSSLSPAPPVWPGHFLGVFEMAHGGCASASECLPVGLADELCVWAELVPSQLNPQRCSFLWGVLSLPISSCSQHVLHSWCRRVDQSK